MGMDYSLVQRIIDGLGKILDTKPGSPDEGTYVTEQQLADWIKGQTVVPAYYYNGVMYSDALHTTPITGQAGALYIDQDNNVLYRWDGAAWDAMSDEQLRQDILDGTVVAKKAECDEDGNNIKATYATKADAVALQSQVDVLDHRLDNLEQAKGKYVVSNYKDGAITPSGKGAWAIVEGLRGVSRVENNLVVNGTFDTNSDWNLYGSGTLTIDTSNHKAVVTCDGSNPYFRTNGNINIQQGHVYLISYTVKMSTGGTMRVDTNGRLGNITSDVATNTRTKVNLVATGSTTGATQLFIYPATSASYANGETVEYEDILLTDLNVYFNTSDLSFLGATDSAKLATIQKDYPHLLLPSEYGTRIVDSSYTGVRAWSPNIWNEEVLRGAISVTDGAFVPSQTGNICSDFIPIVPNASYYLLCIALGSKNGRTRFYDINKNYIGYVDNSGNVVYWNTSFVSPQNAFYMRFEVQSEYGTTYNHDIQISEVNGSVSTVNTTYHPYMESTLSLTFQGKSAGSVFEEYFPCKEVNGEYKSVKTNPLTSYTFTGNESGNTYGAGFYLTLGVDYATSDYLLAGFIPCLYSDIYEGTKVGISMVNGNYGNYAFYDPSKFTTLAELKAYLTGKTLICANPNYNPSTDDTLSDPLIDNTLLTESGGRMATVQTGTVVDGSFDMGFITL